MQLSLKGEPLALGSIELPMRNSHKAAEGGVKEVRLGDGAGISLEHTEKGHCDSSVASISDHHQTRGIGYDGGRVTVGPRLVDHELK